MVSAGDFRNGVTFEMDGDVYQIIEFQHVKPGKGAAFVRTKIRPRPVVGWPKGGSCSEVRTGYEVSW